MAAAIAENPEWLSAFLTMSPDLGSEKFAALHAANTRAGTVLTGCASRCAVPQPIVNTYWISREGLPFIRNTHHRGCQQQVSVVDVSFNDELRAKLSRM